MIGLRIRLDVRTGELDGDQFLGNEHAIVALGKNLETAFESRWGGIVGGHDGRWNEER